MKQLVIIWSIFSAGTMGIIAWMQHTGRGGPGTYTVLSSVNLVCSFLWLTYFVRKGRV